MTDINITIDEEKINVTAEKIVQMILPASSLGYISSNKQAGQDINGFRLVILDGDGKLYYADCTNPDHAGKLFGMSVKSVRAGDYVDVLLFGNWSDTSFNLIPDKTMFLGKEGYMVQSAPPDAEFIQPVGFAISQTELLLNIGEVYFVIK